MSKGRKLKLMKRVRELNGLWRKKLIEITTDTSGWDVLYRDPADGRYWELTYPQSHMHGGGPPRLTHLSFEQAKTKYGDSVRVSYE